MYVDVTGDCVRSEGHWGVNYVCSRWYRRTEPLKLEFSRRGVTGGGDGYSVYGIQVCSEKNLDIIKHIHIGLLVDCARSGSHWGVNYVGIQRYRRTEHLTIEFSWRGVTRGVTVTQFTEYVVRKVSTSSNTYMLGLLVNYVRSGSHWGLSYISRPEYPPQNVCKAYTVRKKSIHD